MSRCFYLIDFQITVLFCLLDQKFLDFIDLYRSFPLYKVSFVSLKTHLSISYYLSLSLICYKFFKLKVNSSKLSDNKFIRNFQRLLLHRFRQLFSSISFNFFFFFFCFIFMSRDMKRWLNISFLLLFQPSWVFHTSCYWCFFFFFVLLFFLQQSKLQKSSYFSRTILTILLIAFN